MSTISIEMPLCLGPSVSVRASTPHQRAYWPHETQVFEPLSTKWSSSSVARVRSDARSEPASGSLKPWHQISSAERIEGMYRRRCSSLPKRSSDGPSTSSPTTLTNSGAPPRRAPGRRRSARRAAVRRRRTRWARRGRRSRPRSRRPATRAAGSSGHQVRGGDPRRPAGPGPGSCEPRPGAPAPHP